jgi:polyphosphate kinase
LIERTISASHGRHVHAPPFWQRVAALAGMELKAMDSKTIPGKQLSEALNDELLETIDEELELEFDDQRLDSVLGSLAPAGAKETLDRRTYFRELLRLQRELIKLQDWVVHQKLKLVVLFEGRDAAGKGGVIKRITQRLNPRVCKVVALSAPTERERTQWYFQRYVSHLPAAGEIVLFDRGWYNRAGVERVMGFCTEPTARSSSALCRNSSGCWSGPASFC